MLKMPEFEIQALPICPSERRNSVLRDDDKHERFTPSFLHPHPPKQVHAGFKDRSFIFRAMYWTISIPQASLSGAFIHETDSCDSCDS